MKAVFKTGTAVALLLASGCITTPRSRQVTDIYRDGGDGTRLAASVERESVQQFRYHLPLFSYLLVWFPSLCFCDGWEIRCKEGVVYRWKGDEESVREEREVLIETTKTVFPLMATLDMVQWQEVLLHYVLTEIDASLARSCEDVPEACIQGISDCIGEDFPSATAESGWFQHALSAQPLAVGRVGQPNTRDAEEMAQAQVHSNDKVVGPIRTSTTASVASPPFVDPNATFNVRIVRRFTAAKSGRLLGTVDERYVLRSGKKAAEQGVCLTLVK